MDTRDDVRLITDALNRIDQFGDLGMSPLTQGAAVSEQLAGRGLPDTSFQRGRILSRLLREEVTRRFEDRATRRSGRDAAEWSILYLRLIDGLSLADIGERLGMPSRSVARYYGRGKALLLDRLFDLDEEARLPHLHCPFCGNPIDCSVTAPQTLSICSRCGARIQASAASPNEIDIHAVREPPA